MSTDTEKDRAKAEKGRIGVTDGWVYLPFTGGAPWDLHHFVRSHSKNSMFSKFGIHGAVYCPLWWEVYRT